MTFFILIVGIAIMGIGAVLWLISNEQLATKEEPKDPSQPPKLTSEMLLDRVGLSLKELDEPLEDEPKKSNKSSGGFFSSFLDKMKLGKKPVVDEEIPEATPFPMLKTLKSDENKAAEEELSKMKIKPLAENPLGSIETPKTNTDNESKAEPSKELSEQEQDKLDKEIDSSLELTELKGKYEQLDKIFKEKSKELEHAQNSLNIELKNQKDFNKVKDLLEKELKNLRNKARDTQVELNGTKAESESYRKRINQLEEKVTKLEKTISKKEEEIEALSKAETPQPEPAKPEPVKEEPIQSDLQTPPSNPDAEPAPPEPQDSENLAAPPPQQPEEDKEYLELRPDITKPQENLEPASPEPPAPPPTEADIDESSSTNTDLPDKPEKDKE